MRFYTGTIKRGSKRAGALGFPTLNIPLKGKSVSGIYAARVVMDGVSYDAAAYADPRRKLLEAHLLDFSGERYGREARIELCEKIRDDKLFDDDAALGAAIADDVRKVREYFQT